MLRGTPVALWRRVPSSSARPALSVAAAAGAAPRTTGAATPSLLFAAAAAPASAQLRWSVLADGTTYKPKGKVQASMKMPMNDHAAKQFLQLAKSAHSTRNLKDAISLYDRVLTHRRNTLGPDHPDVATVLHNIARVFIDARDPGNAQEALRECLRIYERCEGVNSLKYGDSMGLLAVVYRDMQLWQDSEECFKKSLKVYRDNIYDFGANSWIPADKVVPANPNEHSLAVVAHLLSDASTLFLYRQDLDRAASFLEDALEIRRFLYQATPKFRPIIAQTLSKLSEVRRSQGNIVQAEITINEALEICIDTMGRDSPATAAAYSSKGNCHSSRKEFPEALKCYQEACTTYALAFGKSSPLVASELLHIGRMYEMMTKLKEAEQNFEKAITMTTEVLGPDHVQVADAKAFLASVHTKRSRFDLAVPLLRDAVRIRSRVNKNDPALCFVYHRLGDALSALQDPEAEAQFLQAIELHRQHSVTSQRLLMTDCLDDLGMHYIQFRHFDKARECFSEALQLRIEILGDNHPTVGYSYSNMAVYHLAKEEYREGVKAGEHALSVYEKGRVEQQLSVADVNMTIGQCLHGLGDLQGANANHKRCLVIRRKQGEHAELGVAEVLNELARVALDQEQPGDASDYLAEAFKICDRYGDNAAQLRQNLQKTQALFTRDSATPVHNTGMSERIFPPKQSQRKPGELPSFASGQG